MVSQILGGGLMGLGDGILMRAQRQREDALLRAQQMREERLIRESREFQVEQAEAGREFQREIFGAEQASQARTQHLAQQRHSEQIGLQQQQIDMQAEQYERQDLRSVAEQAQNAIASYDAEIQRSEERLNDLNDQARKGELMMGEADAQAEMQGIQQRIQQLQSEQKRTRLQSMMRLRDMGDPKFKDASDADLARNIGLEVDEPDPLQDPRDRIDASRFQVPSPPPGGEQRGGGATTAAPGNESPQRETAPGTKPARNLFAPSEEQDVIAPWVKSAGRGLVDAAQHLAQAPPEGFQETGTEARRVLAAIAAGTPPSPRDVAALRGASDEVLAEHGFTPSQISELRAFLNQGNQGNVRGVIQRELVE